VTQLIQGQVERLEKQSFGKLFDGWPLERIRRLRQHLSRRLLEEKSNQMIANGIKKDLDALLFCENLNANSHRYLIEKPTPERFTETIQRLEETTTDAVEVAVVPMGVAVSVGPAIDVRSFMSRRKAERDGTDPLVQHLRGAIQEQVDRLLAQGPPPEWGCPRPKELSAGAEPSPPTSTESPQPLVSPKS
jgi:hypothetical protein